MKVKKYSSFGNVELSSQKAEVMVDKLNEFASNGKFFSCVFTKKDGSVRKMVARTGVTKVLKGGERILPLKYLCVYDTQAQAYRSINPNTILEINGVEV